MQEFFQRLAYSIGYNCLNQDNQNKRRSDSKSSPNHSAPYRRNAENRCRPSNPLGLHLVRRFCPVQQSFWKYPHTGILTEYRQVLPEIELIPQFTNRPMTLPNLVNRRRREQPPREGLLPHTCACS